MVNQTLGATFYRFSLPLLRLFIRKSKRAYVAIECDGQILLIKNWLSRQDWQLPGAGIKRKERPKTAALREVKEELGIQLKSGDLRLLSQGRWKTDKLGHYYYIFKIKYPEKPKAKVRSWEISEVRWLSPGQIKDSNAPPEILDAVGYLNY